MGDVLGKGGGKKGGGGDQGLSDEDVANINEVLAGVTSTLDGVSADFYSQITPVGGWGTGGSGGGSTIR